MNKYILQNNQNINKYNSVEFKFQEVPSAFNYTYYNIITP